MSLNNNKSFEKEILMDNYPLFSHKVTNNLDGLIVWINYLADSLDNVLMDSELTFLQPKGG